MISLPNDPLWPRAGQLFESREPGQVSEVGLGLLGVPASASSITPTGAHGTPAAIRKALMRYSTHAPSHGVDVATLRPVDFGDVNLPDGPEGEQRVADRVSAIAQAGCELLVALGGDNSITYSVMRGLAGEHLGDFGLVTIDAHHDVRDGESNGSPVRRLIEAGLAGDRVVQLGIADFANSTAYANRARDLGITVVTRRELASRKFEDLVADALCVAGAGGRPVYVDVDVDVCDRAVAPGCPSAAPGGISAYELRELAFLFARDPRVRAMDITEIDAGADAIDGRTVRLGALLVLEAAAGLKVRLG